MTTEIELYWLDESETVTLPALARVCGLTDDELRELVEYGAVVPVGAGQAPPVFSAACVPPLRAATSVRRNFDLDLFAVAVLVDYLRRIETLERRIVSLEAQLPGLPSG